MRTLSLLRHAKSSWDDPTQGDHERPLNKRGTRDAERIGRFMFEQAIAPDLMLCSDAVRTRATLTLVLAELGGDPPRVLVEPRLYLAQPAAILEILTRLEPEVGHCMLVGHNPGMHATALELSGAGDRKTLATLATKFPTAGLAVIDLDVATWNDIRPGVGRLRLFVGPKTL